MKKSVRPKGRAARGRQGRHGEAIAAALTATSWKRAGSDSERHSWSGRSHRFCHSNCGEDFGIARRM
jgi:hypothetical protein